MKDRSLFISVVVLMLTCMLRNAMELYYLHEYVMPQRNSMPEACLANASFGDVVTLYSSKWYDLMTLIIYTCISYILLAVIQHIVRLWKNKK